MPSPHSPILPVARSSLLLVLAVTGMCGCLASPRRLSPRTPDAITQPSPQYPSVEKPVADCLAVALETNANTPASVPHPLNVLVLTGGVEGAPYASGVLSGWSKSGTRPTFDVVTGISSGAFLGMYAFLGPKYDGELQRLMVSLKTRDIVKIRPVSGLFLEGALTTTRPAERLIHREINDCVLNDLRHAHAEGRRFFVGTLCLQTKRLVIWDVGAIASSGRKDADETVRKIMLAAFSYPGFAPAVRFDLRVNGQCYQEDHVDAGAVAMAFVRFGPVPGWPEQGTPTRPGWLAGSNLYLLTCRKMYSDPEPVPKRALPRGLAALTADLDAGTQSQINRIYTLCAMSGMRFHLHAMPPGLNAKAASLQELMPRDAPEIFAAGFEAGARGPAWRLTPPGTEPGEESIPRGSLHLENWP